MSADETAAHESAVSDSPHRTGPRVVKPRYSVAYFEQWRESLRARRSQEAYTKVAQDAKAKGVAIEEELQRRGYPDLSAFRLSCPRFGFLSWPTEMAELGSGVVLYFHFLAFLMLFLAAAFIFQIYPMAFYASFNRLQQWPSIGDCGKTSAWFASVTPGSLGPSNADEVGIPVTYCLLMLLFCMAVVLKSAYQKYIDSQVNAKTVQPNDFAILVQGLPVTATDEAAIAAWFRDHALAARPADIVKVVIGWDVAEYRAKIGELKLITSQLQNVDPTSQEEEYKKLMISAAKIRKDMLSGAPSAASRLTSSGVVVVVFRKQEDLRECVARWDTLCGRCFYREYDGWNAWRGGEALPLFPLGDVPVCQIRVQRAPAPSDINWEDLGVASSQRWTMLLKTNLAMALVIAATFCVCFCVKLLTSGCEAPMSGMISSLLPAITIAFANVAVNAAAKKFGQYEFHKTKAEEISSQSLKMGFGMLANTSLVLLAVNPLPRDWYKESGLIDDLIALLLVLGIFRPLLLWLDMPYYIRKILPCCGRVFPRLGVQRRKLTQELMAHWNEVEQRDEPKTKEEQKELRKVRAEVAYFKKMYQPSEMLMTRRYAYAVNMALCSLFYMPLLPIVPLLGILSLGMQFVVDKYLLVRWFRSPQVQGASQAVAGLEFVKVLGCSVFPLAFLLFLIASWEEKGQIVTCALICFGVGLLVSLIPLKALRMIFGLNFLLSRKMRTEASSTSSSEKDYYEAQYEWTKENKYHQSHFLYKHLPASKNPENLSPETSYSVSATAVKECYGAAAKDGADEIIGDTGEVFSDDSSSTKSTPKSAGSPPTPISYGAGALPEKADVSEAPAEEHATAVADASVPMAAADSSGKTSSDGSEAAGVHRPLVYGVPSSSVKAMSSAAPDEASLPAAFLAAKHAAKTEGIAAPSAESPDAAAAAGEDMTTPPTRTFAFPPRLPKDSQHSQASAAAEKCASGDEPASEATHGWTEAAQPPLSSKASRASKRSSSSAKAAGGDASVEGGATTVPLSSKASKRSSDSASGADKVTLSPPTGTKASSKSERPEDPHSRSSGGHVSEKGGLPASLQATSKSERTEEDPARGTAPPPASEKEALPGSIKASSTAAAEAPVPMASKASAPPPPAPRGPVWERKGDDGTFTPFADDCQATVERMYQEWLSGVGPSRPKISTSGVSLSVDFQRMTQVAIQEGKSHGRVRKIQRTEW
mmetsp:Transcript_40663/g.95561  ORF Transcript_40663/g.95561 Transcript_40663/m.95561 type:complete len:1215 (-) Transcript_40663:136-3780(-)